MYFLEESFMSPKDSLPSSQKPPTNCILCQLNPLFFIPHLLKMYFNNILSTPSRFSQGILSFSSPNLFIVLFLPLLLHILQSYIAFITLRLLCGEEYKTDSCSCTYFGLLHDGVTHSDHT